MKTRKIVLLFVAIAIVLLTLCSCSLLGGNSGGSSGGSSGTGKKVAFTESMIIQNPTAGTGIPVYTGQPITYSPDSFAFEVNGKYPSSSDFTFKYENNVNAGEKTAKLTITAKDTNPYCKGSVILRFSIAPGQAEATDKDSVSALLADTNYESVELVANVTIAESETFTIPEGASLRLPGNITLTIDGALNVAGTLIVDGSTYYGGGSAAGRFINNGTVNVTGTINVASRGEVLNKGTVTSAGGKIKNKGVIYTHDTTLPDLTIETGGVQYVRKALTSEDISLPYIKEGGEEFNQSLGYVRPIPVLEHNALYDVTYTNNDHVGTATVTLTAKENDPFYYGSASVNFTILPGIATVTIYEQLAAAKNSGNYDRYEIGEDLTVPEGETITFDANEKINFAKKEAKLNINGNFINNGTITAQMPYTGSYSGETTMNYYSLAITIGEGGSYSGTGKLSSEKISVVANDNFTFSAPEEVTFASFQQNKGTLTVNSGFVLAPVTAPGKVSTLSFGQTASLVIGENGSVVCQNFSSSSAISNAGTLTITDQFYLFAAAELTNTGTINLGSEAIVNDMKWTNEGTIVNNGEFVCNKLTSFDNTETGFDNTNGHIWTYDAFAYVDENVTLKKKLSVDNVLLEYTETPYTADRKIPTFTVAGEEVTKSDFDIYVLNNNDEIIYTTNTKHNKYNSSYPREVGTYTISIRTNKTKCPYGGNIDLPYRIVKGTCQLTNPLLFTSAITNKNYERINMETDVSVGRADYISQYTLESGITLDTGGYTLTVISSNFYVKGTMILSAPTEDRICSLMLNETSNLRNEHNIVNNGVLCFDSSRERYFNSTANSVTFVNDGIVYGGTDFRNEYVTSGSGNIFRRQTLTEEDLLLEYEETVFDGDIKTPSVSYTGGLITNEVFQTYTVTYNKNKNAGTAEITVKPSALSEVYYGKAQLTFVIKKASKIVTTLSIDDFLDSENYFEVKLANDVILSEDVFVPDDIAFNFSTYSVSCTTGRLLALNGAVLKAEADSRSTFMKNINNVHEMTLIGDITDKITVTFSYPEEHIKYAYYSSYNNNLYTSTLDIKTLTIDMNGYSMTGGFEITTNKKTYSNPYFALDFINSRSQTNTSVIGDVTSTEYGFIQNSIDMKKRIVVNLSDISVAGINLNGHNGGEGIQLNANNCVIETAGQYALNVPWGCINADTEFTDCTFSAAGNNGIICYIYSGKHTFTHCNVTSSSFNWRTDSGMHKPSITIK